MLEIEKVSIVEIEGGWVSVGYGDRDGVIIWERFT